MQIVMKLPRIGTIERAVVDALIEDGAGLAFGELLDVYWDRQSAILTRKGQYRGRGTWIGDSRYQRNSMNLTKILRRWGRKAGATGSRAPWYLRPEVAAVVES